MSNAGPAQPTTHGDISSRTLNNYLQKTGKSMEVTLTREGDLHHPTWRAVVKIDRKEYCATSGQKKMAKALACRNALEKMGQQLPAPELLKAEDVATSCPDEPQ
ncbi:hypothetical protein FRC03_011703 [Tulasnella sp. 419]|nr:hypothetical protein FRC02_005486 [Tulasnella sp. 418]KAG8966565.1 hypothetical protein FRC03_011703 [Tulasnella sp. 419]